jgi:hypothetical protein
MNRFNHNYNESGTSDLREALYLMSQNPPYKFVRLETIRMTEKTTPFFRMIFEGDNITEAQIRYLKNESSNIDFTKLQVLTAEIESYVKSREDYCI